MDGTTILIILLIVVIVVAISSSTNGDERPRDEIGDRAHSANRFQDRDQGGMDNDGGSGE